MALVSTRTTKSEANFIRFCQDVARDLVSSPPFWLRNLDRFHRIFLKFLEHNNSHLPILAFVNAHRQTLQQPVVLDSEPNDSWLLFPKNEPVPVVKSLGTAKPRGVYLAMKDNDWNHCLPLAEVYAVCVSVTESTRRSFDGVSVDTIPAQFLKLFYEMLLEAEPDNVFFRENVTLCEEMVTPAERTGLDLGSTLSSFVNSDSAKQIQGMLQGVASSFDDTAKAEALDGLKHFQESGDLSKLFAGMGPMLQQSGLMDMISGLLPSTRGGASAAETTDEVEDVNPEDQD